MNIYGIIYLGISFFLAFTITYLLSKWNIPEVLNFQAPNFTISPNTTEFTIELALTPSYFNSRGKLYVAMSSPYIKSFKEFKLYMSLDKNSWSEMHPSTDIPSIDIHDYTHLGYVDLNQLNIQIYGKYLIPPQQLENLLPNTSKEDVQSSFKGAVLINTIKTPKDWTLLIITFMSVLGALVGIFNFSLSRIFI